MIDSIQNDRILILDFGSQVTQLIARRIRESGVYCEIYPYMKWKEGIDVIKPMGIILSGGPASVIEESSPQVAREVLDYNVPILGICYGQQTLCSQLGGKVENSSKREFGRANIEIIEDSKFFHGFDKSNLNEPVWMSHGDKVSKIPEGFKVIAKSENAPFAAISNEEKQIYGVQFHPEVVHTPNGSKMLKNFTHLICGCDGDWTIESFKSVAIERIKNQVGSGRVVCGLSGGVDSSVSALLLKEQGYEVHALFMKNWDDDDGSPYCSIKEDFMDAAFVADQIDIPLVQISFSLAYKERVFSYFLSFFG